jgi:hypothetical protein
MHILPGFKSPRARRSGIVTLPVGREDVVLLRRARSSGFTENGTREGGGEAGMEKPTMDIAGGPVLEVEVEAIPASEDANDMSGTGGMDAGSGASVGVLDTVKDVVNKISLIERRPP